VEMVKCTKVVITTAGPFDKYGTNLVKACATTGIISSISLCISTIIIIISIIIITQTMTRIHKIHITMYKGETRNTHK
jgi:hypothetical protein